VSAAVAQAFIPSTWEAEAGGFLSSRSAWSMEWVPEQPGVYRETLSQKKKKKKKKKRKEKKKEKKKKEKQKQTNKQTNKQNPTPPKK
jgi:hypothetical protein